MNKKTVSRVRAFKTSLLVLLTGTLLILSAFTFTCAGASTTVTLTSLAAESGSIRSDGLVNDQVNNVGDTTTNQGIEAFLSFDITGIPAGSTIVDVVIDFSDYTIYGDPFGSSLGDGYLRAYPHDYGTLDGGDYFSGDPLGAIVRFGSQGEMDVPTSDPDVTSELQGKLGASRLQLRLQFRLPTTDNDGINDMVQFHTVKLTVTYSSPDFSVSASPSSQSINPGMSTTYSVTLTSSDGFSDSVSLSVGGLPSGATPAFNPSTVTPTGTSTLTVSTADSTPAGDHTLTITGTGGGLTRQTTVTLTVIPPEENLPPTASFSYSPESPEYGKTVTFDASGSSDPDGTIQLCSWDFGDNTAVSGVTATHSFSSVGTYGVTLTVTDNDGLTATATKDVVVIATGVDITPPVANAGNNMNVKAGSKVTFSAAGSSDNVGIASYEWDFGDGNTGTGVTASHTYDAVGTYTVSLTVKDAAGLSNTVTIVITVEEAVDGFPYWILIPIILGAVVAVAIVWFFLKKRKPKEKVPKPVKLRITAEPTEILADGKTKSAITVELLDKEGKPVPALANTEIKLTTTRGQIEKPVVKIPRGKEAEKTLLVSPKEAGTATLSANVEDLESTSITVSFIEKKRYCMHCGAKMAFAAKRCPECDKSPPAGVDTKNCMNCNSVIPVVAKFCAECGASQPK